jgi:hypothetical protein
VARGALDGRAFPAAAPLTFGRGEIGHVSGFPTAAVGDEGVDDDEEAVWRGISMTS